MEAPKVREYSTYIVHEYTTHIFDCKKDGSGVYQVDKKSKRDIAGFKVKKRK